MWLARQALHDLQSNETDPAVRALAASALCSIDCLNPCYPPPESRSRPPSVEQALELIRRAIDDCADVNEAWRLGEVLGLLSVAAQPLS